MVASVATSGFGTLLAAGDGGVGAGVQASVEWGSGSAKIRIKWKTAGTAGNGKNITVVVSGAAYVYTTLSSTAISITVPTTATVAQVIANLYQQSGFSQYWDADFGATPGDGSGTITARTVTPTAGGTNGTEVFTNIAEVKSISGPNFQVGFADVTHMESPSAVREFLPTLTDPGEISITCNFLPDNSTHDAMRVDMIARTKRNFTMTMTDTGGATVWSFSGYFSQLQLNTPLDGPAEITIGIKLTSTIVES